MNQKVYDINFKSSGMPDLFYMKGFDSIPNTIHNQKSIDLAKKFLKDDLTFFILTGEPGRGKTSIACAMLNNWMTNRFEYPPEQPYFRTSTSIINYLRKAIDENRSDIVTNFYIDAGYLVVDDLGHERPTEFAVEKISDIIDHRYNGMKKTIITTNKSISELSGIYGEWVVSRISGSNAIVCRLDGDDYRKK